MTAPALAADFAVGRRRFRVECALQAAPGERVALFGPSGAGKTTCLEALAGLARLERGEVAVEGVVLNGAAVGRRARRRAVEPRMRSVSFVRQPTTLFPHLSARANVRYGLRGPVALQRARVEQLLDQVGLEEGRDATPDQLSGGQRQRVALARALARPHRLLLLDEPFSAVDGPWRARLRQVAADAPGRTGAVAVLVTHDLAEAQAFGDRLGLIDAGRLLQVGPPGDVVRHPATDGAARLVGYDAFLPAGAATAWALHPERFRPGAFPAEGVVVEGRVRAVRALGPRYACELELATPPATSIAVHLERPPEAGAQLVLTALDPPVVALEAVSDGGRR